MLVFTFSFNLNLSSKAINMYACKKLSHEVRNTGKYDFHRFFIIFIFIFFFKKKHNSITVAVLDLHADRFSSDLVHRHTIFPFTPLLLEKLMIIGIMLCKPCKH